MKRTFHNGVLFQWGAFHSFPDIVRPLSGRPRTAECEVGGVQIARWPEVRAMKWKRKIAQRGKRSNPFRLISDEYPWRPHLSIVSPFAFLGYRLQRCFLRQTEDVQNQDPTRIPPPPLPTKRSTQILRSLQRGPQHMQHLVS